jgi:hypothetical protein
MQVLEYRCRRHGIIAVIERASLRRSHPPKRCPICQGDLSIHVTDHKSTA